MQFDIKIKEREHVEKITNEFNKSKILDNIFTYDPKFASYNRKN